MSLVSAAAPHPEETIVALSSAPGPGQRAIVRISGPQARHIVDAVFSPAEPPLPAPSRARFNPAYRRTFNPACGPLLLPRPAFLHGPRPGGTAYHRLAAARRSARRGPAQCRRGRPSRANLPCAFLAGKLDLPQAEAVHAVIGAGSDADLHDALKQLAGGATQPLHALRDDLLNLLADTEAALDFADEEIEFVGKAETLSRLTAALARLANLKRQFESRTISGRPIRVALVGEPNAGKSSLFNALAGGAAALVSAEAGTTRDYLTHRLDLNGVAVELVDTAGWADAADTIEAQSQRLGGEQSRGRGCGPVVCRTGPRLLGPRRNANRRFRCDRAPRENQVRWSAKHRQECLCHRRGTNLGHCAGRHRWPSLGSRGDRDFLDPAAPRAESEPLPAPYRRMHPRFTAGSPAHPLRRPGGTGGPRPPRRPRPARRNGWRHLY